MKIKINLNREYKLVPEGERVLEITDAKFTPSGAPDRLVLSMKDAEGEGSLQCIYNMKNDTGLWAMGVMLDKALALGDGAEFNTNDVKQLIGIKLLCEVTNSEYNGRNYANVKKVISKVEDTTPNSSNEQMTYEQVDEILYGRNAISEDNDLD